MASRRNEYDLADSPGPAHKAPPYHPPILTSPTRSDPHCSTPPSPLKKSFALLVLLLLVIAVAAAGGYWLSKHTHKKPASPMFADDAYVAEHLDDGVTDDVEPWLDASPRRMVMGMTNQQAKGLAAEWRHMGAKRVIAFGAGLSMSLAIELPANAAQRQPFFDYEHEHHYDFRKPRAKDVGQKWLIIAMHP